MDLKDCILKDVWEDGHHKRFWTDAKTGMIVSDAYKIYKISHAEYIQRNECRNILSVQLKSLLNKILINKKQNIKVRFSKTSLGKIASDKAVTKSVVNGFSVQEHFEVLADLKNIFEKADFVGSFPDRNKDPNIIAIHRLQKDVTLSSGKNAVAYMTLKEVKKQGNRFTKKRT